MSLPLKCVAVLLVDAIPALLVGVKAVSSLENNMDDSRLIILWAWSLIFWDIPILLIYVYIYI